MRKDRSRKSLQVRACMTTSNLVASVLTVAYFGAACIGFRRNLLSQTETGLLIGIGITAGAIILWLLRPA